MPNSTDPPSGAAIPPIIVSHPREPGMFTGNDGVDADEWIRMFERVSRLNRWDPTVMLANAACCLKGTALTWYDTNEETLTSWDVFKEKLRAAFGNAPHHQLAAKNDLASRVQSSTESYSAYIHDVLALCVKVDRAMPEEEKVGHILKGIADDAFNLLVFKNSSNVDDIIAECRRLEQAKSRRIAKNFVRLPNTAATSSCDDVLLRPRDVAPPAPPETLTRIIRREIEAMSPAPLTTPSGDSPSISVIQAVVRQELDNLGLHPVCAMNRQDVYPVLQSPAPIYHTTPRRFRNPAAWRTPDDRPICFCCHRIGHVSRYCRNRPYDAVRTSYYTSRRPENAPRRFSPDRDTNSADAPASFTRLSRSSSPHRRQSLSPEARRATSPSRPGRLFPEN